MNLEKNLRNIFGHTIFAAAVIVHGEEEIWLICVFNT